MPGDALERSNSGAIASIEGGDWRREADGRTIGYCGTDPYPILAFCGRDDPGSVLAVSPVVQTLRGALAFG